VRKLGAEWGTLWVEKSGQNWAAESIYSETHGPEKAGSGQNIQLFTVETCNKSDLTQKLPLLMSSIMCQFPLIIVRS
jgi:hypothetical protein